MIALIDFKKAKFRPKFYRLASEEKKAEIVDNIFRFYRKKGFPYASYTEERRDFLFRSFMQTPPKVVDGTIQFNSSGNALCESFFPNMYDAKRSGYEAPREAWEDDTSLRGLVTNRLRYAKIISDASMRTGIKLEKSCVSNFKPMVAKALYERYEASRILDYSAGYGARLLAAASVGAEYHGYDPCKATFINLGKFRDYLSGNLDFKAEFFCSPFEKSEIRENYYDLAFSSPPYFDYEWYSDDSGQSIKNYPSRVEWMEKFWCETVRRSLRSLVDGGRFAFCLSVGLCSDMIHAADRVCSDSGFRKEEYFRVPFKSVLGGGDRFELIIVYSRAGDLGRTADELIEECRAPAAAIRPSRDKLPRRFFIEERIKAAVEKFKRVHKELGTGRDVYKDRSVIGVPSHVLERQFGTWNKFLKYCGVEPQKEEQSPAERAQEYLDYCYKAGRVLSFYEYGKERGTRYQTAMKRLFNKSGRYNHLRDKLMEAAADPLKRSLFLDLFEL